MMKAVFTITAFAASVSANCDNGCSGHGLCTMDDVCDCYDNWGVGLSMQSGDCSDRICPFEIAWVDSPNADGKFHRYAECAGRGICNRDNGLCECFEGYDGESCHRTTCPNLCSGHGTCEYVEDMEFMAVHADFNGEDFKSDAETLSYPWWDETKTRGCVCDAQYTDIDCSKRLCPYGTDILADREDVLMMEDKYHVQTISFVPENKESTDASTGLAALEGKTFALTFVSRLNETFTTYPIVFDNSEVPGSGSADLTDFANDIRLALLHLPNQVIDNCKVVARVVNAEPVRRLQATEELGLVDNSVEVDIIFNGDAVQGPQNFITVEDYECSSGCTPRITGLGLETVTMQSKSSIFTEQTSLYNSYECGRRGKCDYNSGLCDCFEGYTGENCNTLTTLV